jgi:EAL domain-containing protein (putative c-di-GMP-specific phosphodiesterase class I)
MLAVMQKPFRGDVIPAILWEAGIAMRPAASAATADATGLFEALCAGWVDLCYLPKIELRSGKIVGAEGLVRVVHPKRGVLPPSEIFAGADEASLLALAECALLSAMRDWPAFAHAGSGLRLSVNVPMIALQKLSIASIVREHRPREPNWPGLILEISEDQLLGDIALAHEIATHLRIYNIHLAIDRFGSGGTSLEALGELPFVELKISSAIVAGCAKDANHALLCKAVIDLAHRFKCLAVAEGVDSREDLTALTEMGCDYGQGAALVRAIPKEQLIALIAQKTKERRGY